MSAYLPFTNWRWDALACTSTAKESYLRARRDWPQAATLYNVSRCAVLPSELLLSHERTCTASDAQLVQAWPDEHGGVISDV